MEVWKDIPGYEGIYQASTYGRIRSTEGKTTYTKRHGTRHWQSRVLKGRGDRPVTGKRVSLWKDGTPKEWLVARLVALTFLGEPPEGYTVNHIDGNRLNNNIENLEWLTRGDNIRHGFITGLYKCQKEITIDDGEMMHTFRSYAECDRFLDRAVGYTSGRLKKEKAFLTDKCGRTYIKVS